MLKKNKTIAGILAIFLGTVGIHRFYMGDIKVGLLYLLFFWTGVPTVLGIIDGARYLTQVAELDGSKEESKVAELDGSKEEPEENLDNHDIKDSSL